MTCFSVFGLVVDGWKTRLGQPKGKNLSPLPVLFLWTLCCCQKHTNVKYKSFVDLVVFSNMFVLHKRSVSRVLFNSSSYIIPRVCPLKPAFSFSANTSARRWMDFFIFGVIIKTDQNTYKRTHIWNTSPDFHCQCYKYGVKVLKMLPSPEAPLNQL